MPERDRGADASSEKAKRREAREIVGAYHQEQLRVLLGHVREGFVQLDAGEINEFQLDDLIHRYKRAAKQLWNFCGSSGGEWLQAATALAYMRDRGEERDWWAESASRRDQARHLPRPWDERAAGLRGFKRPIAPTDHLLTAALERTDRRFASALAPASGDILQAREIRAAGW